MDTPKLGKNRLHLDLNASQGSKVRLEERKKDVRREVDRLLKLGAKELRESEDEREYYVVMLDIEGNEFCVQ
jgi:Glyoxalase-like domain